MHESKCPSPGKTTFSAAAISAALSLNVIGNSGAGATQSGVDRVQVSHAAIHDNDSFHKAPLVEGMPFARVLRAADKAKPKALKIASA